MMPPPRLKKYLNDLGIQLDVMNSVSRYLCPIVVAMLITAFSWTHAPPTTCWQKKEGESHVRLYHKYTRLGGLHNRIHSDDCFGINGVLLIYISSFSHSITSWHISSRRTPVNSPGSGNPYLSPTSFLPSCLQFSETTRSSVENVSWQETVQSRMMPFLECIWTS